MRRNRNVWAAASSDLSHFEVESTVNNSGSGNQPKVIGVPPAGQATPQFDAPVLAKGRLTLTWSSGGATAKTLQAGTVTLLTATNLAGPWTVVTNATSPYTIPVDANTPQQFFRLEQQ